MIITASSWSGAAAEASLSMAIRHHGLLYCLLFESILLVLWAHTAPASSTLALEIIGLILGAFIMSVCYSRFAVDGKIPYSRCHGSPSCSRLPTQNDSESLVETGTQSSV